MFRRKIKNFEKSNNYSTVPENKQTISSLWRLLKLILDTLDFNEVVQKIVDSVLLELGYLNLGYSIVVLALVNDKNNTLERISISRTDKAAKALQLTEVPFEDIVIPLDFDSNIGIKALKNKSLFSTDDWRDILSPSYTDDQARELQKTLGIKGSIVFPVIYQNEAQGILIFSLEKNINEISEDEENLIKSYTDIVGLSVQNAKLYTALNETKEKLQKTNNRLKVLDKQKDEFLSMAAHELRAPLTAIKGYVSMVVSEDFGKLPDKAKSYLNDASSVNDRLIRLVNNMLNVSRIEEGRMIYSVGDIHLLDVVKEVYASFRFEAERKKLTFTIESPEGILDKVRVDQDRIHEVVGNFVSNAVKYTENGNIRVKLSNPETGRVRVEVIDTGPGISAAEQKKLFRKFYRVESEVGKTIGTGLGLYISKLLVEKFKGKMGLVSESGKGSNFWFELPLVPKNAPPIQKVSEIQTVPAK